MEPQQQQQQTVNVNEENSSGSKGSYVCRQSSTRWTPTSEQIRILKELYYNCGVRSPNAEQIQRISARLRQYGKIEGKNVFYWFQNHKARERQKKRFTTSDHHLPSHPTTLPNPNSNCKSDHQYSFHNKYPDFTSGFSSASSSSAAGIAVGQMGNYGYGSINMEKSFRDCSISASNNNNGTVGRSMRPSYGWVNCNSSCSFFEKQKSTNETLEHEEQEEDDQDQDDEEEEEEVIKAGEIETLPLFPTQREDINGFCSIKRNPICYTYNWYSSTDDANTTSSRTSLELSLNSYTGQAPDSI